MTMRFSLIISSRVIRTSITIAFWDVFTHVCLQVVTENDEYTEDFNQVEYNVNHNLAVIVSSYGDPKDNYSSYIYYY